MAASCKYGKLKTPVGRRRCKKAPKGKKKGSRSRSRKSSAPSVPASMLNGYRRRRRR